MTETNAQARVAWRPICRARIRQSCYGRRDDRPHERIRSATIPHPARRRLVARRDPAAGAAMLP